MVRGGYISAATDHCTLLCKDGAVYVGWLLIGAQNGEKTGVNI